jgi:hypothetical protein
MYMAAAASKRIAVFASILLLMLSTDYRQGEEYWINDEDEVPSIFDEIRSILYRLPLPLGTTLVEGSRAGALLSIIEG